MTVSYLVTTYVLTLRACQVSVSLKCFPSSFQECLETCTMGELQINNISQDLWIHISFLQGEHKKSKHQVSFIYMREVGETLFVSFSSSSEGFFSRRGSCMLKLQLLLHPTIAPLPYSAVPSLIPFMFLYDVILDLVGRDEMPWGRSPLLPVVSLESEQAAAPRILILRSLIWSVAVRVQLVILNTWTIYR